MFVNILFSVHEVHGVMHGETTNTILSIYFEAINEAPSIVYHPFPSSMTKSETVLMSNYQIKCSDPDEADAMRTNNLFSLVISTTCGYLNVISTEDMHSILAAMPKNTYEGAARGLHVSW